MARKALAGALSQVVLSRETILVHAESVLDHAELIEGSLHSSALNLWFAVLRRAEAEGAVERLVAAVLEENPGAERLRQALHDWQHASVPPPSESSVPETVEPELAAGEGALPNEPASLPGRVRSEQARWLVLAAVGLGIAWLFIRRQPPPAEEAGLGRRAAPPVAVAPAAAQSALEALRPRALPTKVESASEGDAGSVQKTGR